MPGSASKKRTAARRRIEQRLAAEAAARAAAARRRRAVFGGIAAVVLVIVAVVVVIVVQSRRTETSADAPVPATPPTGRSRGDADAPVTIDLYEDFQCPNCKTFEASTGETIAELSPTARCRRATTAWPSSTPAPTTSTRRARSTPRRSSSTRPARTPS